MCLSLCLRLSLRLVRTNRHSHRGRYYFYQRVSGSECLFLVLSTIFSLLLSSLSLLHSHSLSPLCLCLAVCFSLPLFVCLSLSVSRSLSVCLCASRVLSFFFITYRLR